MKVRTRKKGRREVSVSPFKNKSNPTTRARQTLIFTFIGPIKIFNELVFFFFFYSISCSGIDCEEKSTGGESKLLKEI